MGRHHMAHHLNQLNQGDIQSPDDLFSFAMNELKLGVKHPSTRSIYARLQRWMQHNQPHARTVVSRGIAPPYTQLRVHSDQRSLKTNIFNSTPPLVCCIIRNHKNCKSVLQGSPALSRQAMIISNILTILPNMPNCVMQHPTAPGTPITESTKRSLASRYYGCQLGRCASHGPNQFFRPS